MTNDSTQDQFTPRGAPEDDVEGHLRPLSAAPEDDVEGHFKAMAAPEEDDDVKGHLRSFAAPEEEDDVKGHSFRTYPAAAADDGDEKDEFYGRL